MKLININRHPTTINLDSLEKGTKGLHESCFRSFMILLKIRHLLENDVPANIILELMDEMESPSLTAQSNKPEVPEHEDRII